MNSSVIRPGDIREVAATGLGLMGSGIAELVARSGRSVNAIEMNPAFTPVSMLAEYATAGDLFRASAGG